MPRTKDDSPRTISPRNSPRKGIGAIVVPIILIYVSRSLKHLRFPITHVSRTPSDSLLRRAAREKNSPGELQRLKAKRRSPAFPHRKAVLHREGWRSPAQAALLRPGPDIFRNLRDWPLDRG